MVLCLVCTCTIESAHAVDSFDGLKRIWLTHLDIDSLKTPSACHEYDAKILRVDEQQATVAATLCSTLVLAKYDLSGNSLDTRFYRTEKHPIALHTWGNEGEGSFISVGFWDDMMRFKEYVIYEISDDLDTIRTRKVRPQNGATDSGYYDIINAVSSGEGMLITARVHVDSADDTELKIKSLNPLAEEGFSVEWPGYRIHYMGWLDHGRILVANGETEGQLTIYDSAGEVLSSETNDFPETILPWKTLQLGSGRFLIIGRSPILNHTHGSSSHPPVLTRFSVRKYRNDGEAVWARTLKTEGRDVNDHSNVKASETAVSGCLTHDGEGALAIGKSRFLYNYYDGSDGLVARIDLDGQWRWYQRMVLGGNNTTALTDVARADSGSYLLVAICGGDERDPKELWVGKFEEKTISRISNDSRYAAGLVYRNGSIPRHVYASNGRMIQGQGNNRNRNLAPGFYLQSVGLNDVGPVQKIITQQKADKMDLR